MGFKMAVPESSVVASENMSKKRSNKSDKKLIATAQDIKYAKFLAGNDKKTRDRALKSLRKWFEQRSQAMPFDEKDFMLIWKGLFYSMWMSDKLLVQEECAENIALLMHALAPEFGLLYFKCGLNTLKNEWFGIDQLRLDKFLTLTRRLLRQSLEILNKQDWNLKLIHTFQDVLQSTMLCNIKKSPLGLTLHFTEIYLEELAKVSRGEINHYTVKEFLIPFVKQMSTLNDARQISCIMKNIFRHLLRQSDAGLDYDDKFSAWKRQGFPGGHINAMQMDEQLSDEEKVSSDDSGVDELNADEGALDARAGHVDVILPQLKFSAKQIAGLLKHHRFVDGSNTKSRKAIGKLIEEFLDMSRGSFPLGIKTIDLPKRDVRKSTSIKQSVNRLFKFEKQLQSQNKRIEHDEELLEENISEAAQVPTTKTINNNKKRKKNSDAAQKTQKRKRSMDLGEQLERFIQNGGATQKRKMKLPAEVAAPPKKCKLVDTNAVVDKNFEYNFERNSGCWYVYNERMGGNNKKLDAWEATPTADKQTKPDIVSPKNNLSTTPVKVVPSMEPVTTSTPTNRSLFSESEWDTPLKDGEVEIFVPAKKYKLKMEAMAKRSNQNVTDLITSSLGKQKLSNIRGKSMMVRNPFSSCSSISPKKVKIDLRMNRSQEVHEHVARIKSSPSIPFDANRRPNKPLLKPFAVQSPIDPFYKLKRRRTLHL